MSSLTSSAPKPQSQQIVYYATPNPATQTANMPEIARYLGDTLGVPAALIHKQDALERLLTDTQASIPIE